MAEDSANISSDMFNNSSMVPIPPVNTQIIKVEDKPTSIYQSSSCPSSSNNVFQNSSFTPGQPLSNHSVNPTTASNGSLSIINNTLVPGGEGGSPFVQQTLIQDISPSVGNPSASKVNPTHHHHQQSNSTTGVTAGTLASQLCPLGPKDRCTPSQAQAMGQQILSLMVAHENNKMSLPYELQNTFDIFHRCLAVAYGTFFLHLYTKANAPCLLCHGCKSLYPPGQYIHHACPALPPNIVPCRSRMWRRCLVPLVSQDIDKMKQKERWRYVLEKFSHNNMGVVRRNRLPIEAEVNLLDMPECKRGRFIKSPSNEAPPTSENVPPATLTLSTTTTSSDIVAADRQIGGGENDILIKEGVSFVQLMNGGDQTSENSSSFYMTSNGPALLLEVNQDDDLEASHDHLDDHTHSDEPTITTMSSVPILNVDNQKQQDSLPSQKGNPSQKAIELVEDLVKEIKRLENELHSTRNALQLVEKQLNTITKSSNVSEQLVRSLMAQDKLTVERDQAIQRAVDAEERVTVLETHINQIQKLQNQVLRSV